MKALFKSDGAFDLPILVKKQENFDEQGLLTGLVYVPDAVDSHGDFADAETVRDMAHNFLSNGGHVDVDHNGDALSKDKVRICETFVVQKDDPRFAGVTDYEGEAIDPTGSWGIVLKLLDADLRKNYREEGWAGLSMFGMAEMEEVAAASEDLDVSDRIIKALAKKLRGENEENEMDQETLLAALTKNNENLVKGIVDAIRPKKDDDGEPSPQPTIKFEGDPDDPADVQEHLRKIEIAKIDWDDPKQVSKYLASIKKTDDDSDDGDDDDGAKKLTKSERAEVKKLKAQLAKLEGKSNVPEGEDNGDGGGGDLSIEDRIAKGRKMADFINKSRGFAVAGKE